MTQGTWRTSVGRTAVAVFAVGCVCNGGPARDVADDEHAKTLLLAVDVDFETLDIPPHSRGDDARPPERIPLRGWRNATDGERGAVTELPVRTRNLYFFKPPTGMKVVRADGTEVPHRYTNPPPPFWTYDEDAIRVHGWSGTPADEDLFLVWDVATGREAALNWHASKAWLDAPEAEKAATNEVFVRTTAQVGNESRTGLLLPAPATAAWDIEVPPSADLRFSVALVPPEVMDGPASDGATVSATFEVEGKVEELWTKDVRAHQFEPVRVDLGRFAGKRGRLTVRSDPKKSPRFDYIFLADPVVASRKAHPRRVFMVFVDTLRQDHVSAFGYHRETTPALDDIAATAARFTQARNVAPWTLPSTRSVLTGRDPEDYFDARTVQGVLRERGFATAMFAGNVYLTSNFALNRDWGLHHIKLLPRAEYQLDHALAWLEENEGRDLLLLLHLMDCHLPYEEPAEYRRLFAGDPPETLKRDSFHRDAVMNAHLKTKEDRQYLRDRYDNNIRYSDDQLKRLYDLMGPDDVLVFFSDHGEEFWDHGGFEHGHSLYDELLRVPLVIKAPGLPSTGVDAPVSLLDVAPTILDLLGVPVPEDMTGRSLVALAKGDKEAAQAFDARPLAFGRPLYGGERWGVLDQGTKYVTLDGRESAFDLESDPEERKDLIGNDRARALPLREKLGEALRREVALAWRFAPRGARQFPDHPLVAKVTVPGGIKAAWVGEDPTESSAARLEWDGKSDTATITWPTGYRGSRDVWVVPAASFEEATPGLAIVATEGEVTLTVDVPDDAPTSPANGRNLVLNSKVGERSLDVGFGIMAIPRPDQKALSGFDPALADQLAAMGYVVGAGEEKAPKKPKEAPEAAATKPPTP